MRLKRHSIWCVLILAMQLAACKSHVRPGQNPYEIVWLLTTKHGQKLPSFLLGVPTLVIHEDRIVGADGCDTFGSVQDDDPTKQKSPLFKLTDTEFVIAQLKASSVVCNESIRTFAQDYLATLLLVRTYRVDHGTLYLMDADGKEQLTFAEDTSRWRTVL